MGKGPMKLPLTEEKLLVDRQQSLPFNDSEVDDEGVSVANVSNSNDNVSTEQKESSNNTHTVKAISNQKQITSENAPILDNISEETIIKSAASLTTASKDLQKIILLYNDGSFEVFQN
jgi:conjugal transfer/entry exclusion protein